MGFSKDKLGRFVRAALVSGLLGAGGLLATATPAMAGDPGSDAGPAPGTDAGSDAGSDNGSDDGGTTSGGTTDAGTTDGGTTIGGTTTDSSLSTAGTLAETGNDASVPLLLGGAAIAAVVAGRKLLTKV